MNNRIVSICIAVLMMTGTVVDAAPFNQPSHLINIPIYKEMTTGDLSFSTAVSAYNPETLEFDYSVDYAVTSFLKLGLTYHSKDNFVGNIHSNLFSVGFLIGNIN